jgi:hypothetical protein
VGYLAPFLRTLDILAFFILDQLALEQVILLLLLFVFFLEGLEVLLPNLVFSS